MSHVAKMNCEIRDIDALDQAVRTRSQDRAELVRGQTEFQTWGSSKGRCAHAIRLKNASRGQHEVGLQRKAGAEEVYDFAYDQDGSGRNLDALFGANLIGLQDEYLAVVAAAQLQQAGYRVTQEYVDGGINVVAYA